MVVHNLGYSSSGAHLVQVETLEGGKMTELVVSALTTPHDIVVAAPGTSELPRSWMRGVTS